MAKIYYVSACGGSYEDEDYFAIPIAAYTKESDAQEHANKAQAWQDAWKAAYHKRFEEIGGVALMAEIKAGKAELRHNPFDPDTYKGAEYYTVQSVELIK